MQDAPADRDHYSLKPTGTKSVRYDEFTGEPYEIDDMEFVKDPNGMFGMVTIQGPRFTWNTETQSYSRDTHIAPGPVNPEWTTPEEKEG